MLRLVICAIILYYAINYKEEIENKLYSLLDITPSKTELNNAIQTKEINQITI